jgi:hypothetical protein
MAEVSWSLLTRPGEVVAAATATETAADGQPLLAAATEGGHVYVRHDDGTGWRWEHLGAPPGRTGVSAVACLTPDEAGTVPRVVVGSGDGHVWLAPLPGAPGDWVDLGAPAWDTEQLSVISMRRPAGLRHVLVAGTNSGRPWLREGLDPDGTWFGIAGDVDWELEYVALAVAATAPGSEPQLHVVAVVRYRETFASAVLVAFRENSVWTWADPGPPPAGVNALGLSATSIRDTTGTVRVCAVIGVDPGRSGSDLEVGLLIGGGRSWRWDVLGHPEGLDMPRAAVAVHRAVDPADGSGPVVVARVAHDHWRRSPTGEWVSLGAVPGDTTVVNPSICIEAGSGASRVLWETGVSWNGHLWTVRASGDGVPQVVWTDHGIPATIATVVGADIDPPDADGNVLSYLHVVDNQGALYRSTMNGDTAGFWDDHDRPAPDVAVRTGVGTLTLPGADGVRSWVFVLGGDGHLWARSRTGENWSWVDHGQPSGRRVKSALPPVLAQPSAPAPSVLAVAEDGQLWLRAPMGDTFDWTSRGTPPGHLIFSLVGVAAVPRAGGQELVTAVVADDGHVWLHVPSGATPWLDLGAPTVTERVAAGVGAALVTTPAGTPVVHLVVVTTPGGHAWTRTWSPAAEAARWTDLSRPDDVRIEAGIGVLPLPHDRTRALVFLLGGQGKLWTRDTLARDPGWDLWDRAPETDTLGDGRVAVLNGRVAVVITGGDGRFWLSMSRDF